MKTRGEQCVANWVVTWKIRYQILTVCQKMHN